MSRREEMKRLDAMKRQADLHAELRERKIVDAPQVTDIIPVSPGMNREQTMKEMLKNASSTRDMSQESIGRGKETMKIREQEGKVQAEIKKDLRKKG
jgi:hypothetical protein